MSRTRVRLAAVAAVLSLLATACGEKDTGGAAETRLLVVATTTMLGDLAVNVVGDEGTVEVLLPLGADPHAYQASARQAALVQRADLVIANGLGLEEGLADVLESAADDGASIIEIGELVDPLPFGAEPNDDHEPPDLDPHVWLDPLRMADAAREIGSALEAIHPDGGWPERADGFAAELAGADTEIREILSAIPEDRRSLVTNHRSFGYFADRYGFEVVGVVIPGGSTLADPSSAELARLVGTLREHNISAIFGETTEPVTLAEAISEELGGSVEVVRLYTGSLGEPGSGADTLIGMLLTNAELIAGALA